MSDTQKFGDVRRNFDLLADAFLREGVDTVFALLGDANMHWATRIAEQGCGMTYVRHEHAAVAAAMAYARLSGKVGVASVTCGPGLTNTLTALPAAAIARVPLVVFAGEPAIKAAWYNQMIEQAPFATASGAAYHRMHDPSRFVQTVRDAFVQARLERRPVVLGVPMDLQDLPASLEIAWPRSAQDLLGQRMAMPPNLNAVQELLELINAASRVVVLGGLGAKDAVGPARHLAERCDGLLATTLPARGLYNDDPFSVGMAGGLASPLAGELLAEADLVLAFGASLAHHTSMGGKVWPKAQVVQIDVDPLIINQGRAVADRFVQADAGLTIEALLARLPPRKRAWRTPDLAKKLQDAPAFAETLGPDEVGAFDPRSVVMALDSVIPPDWMIINTSGHVSGFTAQMQRRPFGHFLTIREFGAIGNGTSFALGAAAAQPDKPVVLVDGDGSLLMHIQEMETIARHKLPVLIAVLNDGAYGSAQHGLCCKCIFQNKRKGTWYAGIVRSHNVKNRQHIQQHHGRHHFAGHLPDTFYSAENDQRRDQHQDKPCGKVGVKGVGEAQSVGHQHHLAYDLCQLVGLENR